MLLCECLVINGELLFELAIVGVAENFGAFIAVVLLLAFVIVFKFALLLVFALFNCVEHTAPLTIPLIKPKVPKTLKPIIIFFFFCIFVMLLSCKEYIFYLNN